MKLKILFIIFIFLIPSSCCFASEDVNEIVEQNMGINSLSSSSNNDNLIDTQQEYLDTHLERNVVDYFNSNITEKKFCEVNEEENLEVLNQENYPNSKAYLDVSVDNHSFGEVIEIKGYLRNSSNILSNKKITIQLSNNSYVCKTDYNGYFTYNITKYEEGLNNVTVIFNDENYNESAFRQFVVFKNISSEDNRIQNDYKANNSLNIPTKKFTEYFNFLFEMDKDLLFEGSHLSQANIEIFCKRINQLPSGVTKVLYMGYGFSKTIAEKSTQFIIIKISGRNEIVDEMFSSIDSVKYSNINTKRLKYFETKNKEYFYVEESSYDRILGVSYEVL